MTKPQVFLIRMTIFLIAVIGIGALLFAPLKDAFMANAPLNGLILGVLIVGCLNNIRQVLLLGPEVNWIEDYRSTRTATSSISPKLLAPMAAMLGEKDGKRLSLSAMSTRSMLDGIATRLEESRDLSRYTIGLLIFLGLLGTFWGLLETVGSVSDVIAGLTVTGGDIGGVFGDLKQGLEAPLEGMGTAFSSSLFGLAGSLVLGFLDLQLGQAQNRFYTDLEDWLSAQTRLSSGALGGGDGDASVPAYVQALLEQTAESLEGLQSIMARGEEKRALADQHMMALVEKLGALSDQMRTEQKLMAKLAEGQLSQKAILEKIADGASMGGGGMDDATRTHLRNLDVYAQQMVQEMSAGREEIVRQMKSEIKFLARTIAAIAEDER